MKQLQRLSMYQVESIQGRKIDEHGKRLYLIKWKGWEERYNTWEPMSNLSNVKIHVKSYDNSLEKLREDVDANSQTYKKEQESQKKERKEKSHKKENKVEEAELKKQEKVEKIQQKQEVQPKVELQQPVKRGRGRPKKIRPSNQGGEQQKQKQKKSKQKVPKVRKDKSYTKDLNIIKETLSIIAQQRCDIQHFTSKVDTPKKRKCISKPRPKSKRSEQLIVKIQEQSNQRQQRIQKNESAVVLPVPSTEQGMQEVQIDDEQSQEIQQVLLKCKNYQRIKVTFKEGAFSYEIPYISEGMEKSILLNAEEIIKVNPKWFQGYFQGFFL